MFCKKKTHKYDFDDTDSGESKKTKEKSER